MNKSELRLGPTDHIDPNYQAPKHFVKKIRADGTCIVVSGFRGEQEVEERISRADAIQRAKALNGMISNCKYADEARQLGELVQQFILAINAAKEASGKAYNSSRAKLAVNMMTNPTSFSLPSHAAVASDFASIFNVGKPVSEAKKIIATTELGNIDRGS